MTKQVDLKTVTKQGLESVKRVMDFYHGLWSLEDILKATPDASKETQQSLASMIKKVKKTHIELSDMVNELIEDGTKIKKLHLNKAASVLQEVKNNTPHQYSSKIAAILTELEQLTADHANTHKAAADEDKKEEERIPDSIGLDLPQALMTLLKELGAVVIDSSEDNLNTLASVPFASRKEVRENTFTFKEMKQMRADMLSRYGDSGKKGHKVVSFMFIAKSAAAVLNFFDTYDMKQKGRAQHRKDIMVASRPYGVFVAAAEVSSAVLAGKNK